MPDPMPDSMPDASTRDTASTPAGANEPVDLLVVGGGPAGLAAARAYRESGGQGRVLLLSADEHPPYNRPPLTKDYLRGEVEADTLPLVPDDWYVEQRVALHLRCRVIELELTARNLRYVTSTEGDDAPSTTVGYRRLVLATGSSPRPLPIPGADLPGVIYVREQRSAVQMRDLRGPGHRVVVIGSGFIGCEAAASLASTGAGVVLATDEDVPHAARLGADAGRRIKEWLRADGVDVRTGNGVASIERRAEDWLVKLDDGTELACDGVISGSGVSPNTDLAQAAGLELIDGGVATDASMRTSDPAVWAAGDIAYATNTAAGRRLRVEHWGEAETMGEIAGTTAAGGSREWGQGPGFWSEIGDHTLKYSAWGDGHDSAELTERSGADGWAVWYVRDGVLVGVLTSDWDEAYEQGQALLEAHAPIADIRSITEPAGESSGSNR